MIRLALYKTAVYRANLLYPLNTFVCKRLCVVLNTKNAMVANIEHPRLKLFQLSEIDSIVRSVYRGKDVRGETSVQR
jgi:hypothetical protein